MDEVVEGRPVRRLLIRAALLLAAFAVSIVFGVATVRLFVKRPPLRPLY